MDDDQTAQCIDQLTPERPAETAVLAVTLTDSPDSWLRRFRQRSNALPSRIGLIVAGGHARSTSAVGGTDGWRLPPTESISVTMVDEPGDLTAIGIKISEFIEQWALEASTADDPQLKVCFDSLTVLVQYADIERVFRFLHVLIARLAKEDVEAHFHLDPSTQDEQTMKLLGSLFDEVDGEVPTMGG